ncbi:MAG: glycoside hydrolase family 5 protein [Candidatus Heimdallarchaeota archaeon]|nr:glycoside hydrolase family 5 protein [Candidatus Heimdallarchaeota archaeon]
MFVQRKFVIILPLLVMSGIPLHSIDFQSTGVYPHPLPDNLFRGINFGNSLEAPAGEESWGIYINETDFDVVKQAGFDTVRIPVKWSSHSLDSSPFTINETFALRVDEVIQQGLQRNLSIIINIHHFDVLMVDPILNKDWFISLWEQISDRYKDHPSKLFFEVLNEPRGALLSDDAKWNEIQNAAIAKIRETNPTRKIIVTGNFVSSYSTLDDLNLPADDNLIATFHYYNPLDFTHQGATWTPIQYPIGKRWEGTDAQKNSIVNSFNMVASWSFEMKIPVIMTEFGVIDHANIDDRARWTAFVARTAEERNIAWTYWDFKARFAAFNETTQTWIPELLEALIAPYSPPSLTTIIPSPEESRSYLVDTNTNQNNSLLSIPISVFIIPILLIIQVRKKQKSNFIILVNKVF